MTEISTTPWTDRVDFVDDAPRPSLALLPARMRNRKISRRTSGSAVGRLLPRFLADALAIFVGVSIFEALDRSITLAQMLAALGFFAIALLIDATHVRIEWNYVEEFTLSLKTSVIALVLIATTSFLSHLYLSRTLFLIMAGTMAVSKPFLAMLIDRLTGRPPVNGTALVMCGDDEYLELVSATGESFGPPLFWGRVWDGDDEVPTQGFVGSRSDLLQLCKHLRPGKVVFGRSHELDAGFLRQVAEVNELGIPVRSLSRSFAEDFGRIPLKNLDTSWFLFDIAPLHRLGYRFGRRIVDIVAGVLVGFIFLIFLPLFAIIVKIDSPGPVFFIQDRVGQKGRVFKMYKVRTMTPGAEKRGPAFVEKNDHRVTRLGRALRRSRIDELPQAINLIRGDMSLIGPRPERPEWVERYQAAIPFYEKRHLLKPGLTGWAQVHEGYGTTEAEAVRKLERDLYYLRYRSLGLDLRILIATLGRVLRLAGQ